MKIRNERGVTLVILVFTVVLLAILVSTVTIASRQSITFTKETKFISELKVIREKVNIVKKEMELGSTAYENTGRTISEVHETDRVKILTALESCGISSDEQENYQYFSSAALRNFGIYDIEQNVLINFDNLDIISVNGLEIDGQTYYTIESVEEIM